MDTNPRQQSDTPAPEPPRSASQPPPGSLLDPRRLARSLSVEPGEERRTALLFVLLFLASMVFVMGRTARDALFLTQFPVTWIAYMWVAYGIVSSFVAVGYGWISTRYSRERLTMAFAVLSSLSYVGVRVAVGAELSWAIAFFYVWAEVIANLFVLQAWAITNDLHDPRSARRLFGLIGAGRILGMLLSGFITGGLVRAIGTPNLILVISGLMLAFAALVRLIGKRYQLAKPKKPSAHPVPAPQTKKTSLRRHFAYTSLLSVMLLVIFLALTIGDYQFKAIAKLSFPDRDDLAGYMAGFYAAMGAIAFVFQVFITPRILKHLGVVAALLTMPLAFLSSTAVLLGLPILPVATVLKLSDNGLQYTIHDATMQLLYFAFPTSVRTRVRGLLDAMIKPMGYSLGGVVLVILSPVPFPGETAEALSGRVAQVGLVSLLLGVVWIAIVPFVRRAYVDALRRSLVRRQSDLSQETDLQVDAAVKNVLRETVRGGSPAQVVFALERLVVDAPDVAREELPALMGHESPTVRAMAVENIAQLDRERAADLARAHLADPDAEVRCAALATLGAVRHEDAVDEIEHFAYDDKHPRLRNGAIVTMIVHGGLPGVLAGGARLQQMIQSPDEMLRVEAATILGDVGQPTLARTLKPLLRDSSLHVRRAAAFAARGCASRSLVNPILDAMPERSLIKPLIRALVAVGPDAISELSRRLGSEETPRLVRLNIPRVLHGIGAVEGLEVLRACFDCDDEGVRQKCLASASRLREDLQAPPLPAAMLKPLIAKEVSDHIEVRDGYLRLRRWVSRPLLDKQLRLELRGNIVRIMRLCEQAYPRTHVAAARSGIFSRDATKRANALEVLDNVLDREIRVAILDIVDRFACDCDFGVVPNRPGEPVSEKARAWFEHRITLPGHYRRSLLFEAVGVNQVVDLADAAFAYARRANPFMRENALIALAACRPNGWRSELERATDDTDPVVRAYATFVLQTGCSGIDPEDDMYTTVEKILYLQGVPLFSGAAGNDLMPLAMRSRVVQLAPGDVVFREGDPGDSLFIVFHGQIALTSAGKELAVLGEGEVVGEMAILDEAPRMVTATAVNEADVLRVSAEDFRNTLQDTAEFANGVIFVLAKRLRDLMDHQDMVRTDMQGRKTAY
jgi:ATP/ADP translocase/HEAT repeat protein